MSEVRTAANKDEAIVSVAESQVPAGRATTVARARAPGSLALTDIDNPWRVLFHHTRATQISPFVTTKADGVIIVSYYLDNDPEKAVLHRADGPAEITFSPDGSRVDLYCLQGKPGRVNGPVCVWEDEYGTVTEYYDGFDCSEGALAVVEHRRFSTTEWRYQNDELVAQNREK
jgi:hypothetical protein